MRIFSGLDTQRTSLPCRLVVIRDLDSVLQEVSDHVILEIVSGVPGSGATSVGATLRGASRSTCVGSSNEGAMITERTRKCKGYMEEESE